VLASHSVESAEVAALEEEMANELAKEVGGRGKGNARGSPDLDEGRSITLKPARPTLTQTFTVRPVSLLGIVTLLHPQESKAHLLVAALHAAVPLRQVHSIAKLSLLGRVTLLACPGVRGTPSGGGAARCSPSQTGTRHSQAGQQRSELQYGEVAG